MHRQAATTLAAVFAVGCTCNDLEIHTIPNEPPEVDILSHENGDHALEAFTTNFRANVLDDSPVEESIATWFVDETIVCEGPVPEIGTAECDVLIPDLDEMRVRVEIRDIDNAVATDRVDLVIDPTFPPTVDILSPTPGHRYYRNVPVPLEALVTDNEDVPTLISVSWATDVDGDLPAATVLAGDDGVAASSHNLTQNLHVVTATATDSTGKTGSDTVTIEVGGDNHEPTCSIVVPLDGSIQTVEQPIAFEGRADDEDLDDPSDLVLSWSSDIEGNLGTSTPDYTGIVTWESPGLSRGIHEVTMTVIDDAGWTCAAAVTLSVTNEAPTAPEVHIEPESPVALEDIVCHIDEPSTDPEGAPLTYVFTWLRDGAPFYVTTTTILPGDTVDAAFIAPGQVWTCEARAFDGIGTGDAGIDQVIIEAPSVVQVAVNDDHSCQVDNAVTATCWGDNQFGKLDLSGTVLTYIGTGANHSCGLQLDGSPACVGADDLGQLDFTNLTPPFTQLEVGSFFNCAIDTGKGIQCWGSDADGQVSDAPAGDFLMVSAGFSHACAIEADNDVVCWGLDAFGRATPPAGVKMSFISAGKSHSCGIDLSGVMHCWGKDNVGQTDAPLGSFVKVSSGDDHSCAIDGADNMVCWGIYTDEGELNEARDGTWSDVAVWTHSCAVDLAGVATCWGEDAHGETLAPVMWW